MDINQKIKPAEEYVNPARTDETGKCFMRVDDGGTHYYRQDRNSVTHMCIDERVLVNLLPNNHLESARKNWGDIFDEISEKEFENILSNTLAKFYEV